MDRFSINRELPWLNFFCKTFETRPDFFRCASTDADLAPDTTCYCKLEAVDLTRASELFGPEIATTEPEAEFGCGTATGGEYGCGLLLLVAGGFVVPLRRRIRRN